MQTGLANNLLMTITFCAYLSWDGVNDFAVETLSSNWDSLSDTRDIIFYNESTRTMGPAFWALDF